MPFQITLKCLFGWIFISIFWLIIDLHTKYLLASPYQNFYRRTTFCFTYCAELGLIKFFAKNKLFFILIGMIYLNFKICLGLHLDVINEICISMLWIMWNLYKNWLCCLIKEKLWESARKFMFWKNNWLHFASLS